ncbi:Protein ENHANCED DISEASE RESISTANCE 2 [Mucuna pruriens]|uniref:Protein ENHANCED DISEASE RESISTANCE 2 n=1 Tax=Mucuna pruriens TaxID=157652 RepID=A0A371GU86_MUCPR|nr:Protein ENHANCED DISEASE RESISTANCE 2 [Mucuna pruriens]
MSSKVVYEGWMVRYGRRKIGRSFIHMRYFVLESRLLAYYKRKPQDNQLCILYFVGGGPGVPIKTLLIDGNCRVEDRGLKTHHGHIKEEIYYKKNSKLGGPGIVLQRGRKRKNYKMVYVLSVYNKKEKNHRIMMAAFNIQEALIWKEKIEYVIDQHQGAQPSNGNKYISFEYKSGMDNGKTASSSDRESQFSAQEDEDDPHPNLLRRTTIGNGPPESVFDWTREIDSDLSNQNINNQVFSRKHWRLLQCQDGLRVFEELVEVDYLPRSCSRAMKAVGVVEATCEEIFELVMSMDGTRWDCSFLHGSLVEEVDGHTAVLYHRLQLDWFPMFVWPRDLCYVRYWRRNDDGSYVVLFRSREHENCGPQPGCVRAHIESGGFNISPLKPRNGRPRTQVQHLMQIDLKGWGVGYLSSFQQHCVRQMLNSVAGLREWFAQSDERNAHPRIPVMVNMSSTSVSSKKNQKPNDFSVNPTSLDQINAAGRNSALIDEYSDDEEDFQIAEPEQEVAYQIGLENDVKRTVLEEEPANEIDLSSFSGNLRRDDRDNARDCWKISDGNNFRVRSKHFCHDKSKVPAGKHMLDLVAVDWFKDSKRMDHVARRHGCAAQRSQIHPNPQLTAQKIDPILELQESADLPVQRPQNSLIYSYGKINFSFLKVASEKGFFSIVINLQVPASTHYSMELVSGSLLHRFVDGDDEFRNSRLKLIPSVPKCAGAQGLEEMGKLNWGTHYGSWIVRQSVGSTPCLLGKAVDCNYIRGPKYLEIDVDIGSSTVANGVLGLVIGVITTLVVDMAFLVQANTPDELPERLVGAVRISHLELKSAIVPKLEPDPS